jgi:hypothetical protein
MHNGSIRRLERSILYVCAALLLACNYFAFQVELFEDEYEANQPMRTETGNTVSSPTITWESFDKDHAKQPLLFKADFAVQSQLILRPVSIIKWIAEPDSEPIRDKSPPPSS